MEGLGDDIPDFDELEKLKVEFSKQLEKTKNEFEEKLQIKEDEEEWYRLSASELSLVSGLEIPYISRPQSLRSLMGQLALSRT